MCKTGEQSGQLFNTSHVLLGAPTNNIKQPIIPLNSSTSSSLPNTEAPLPHSEREGGSGIWDQIHRV